jgi:hypothetical protein
MAVALPSGGVSRSAVGALLLVALAGAEEPPRKEATKDEARQAVQAFTREFKEKAPEAKIVAIDRLGAVDHALVADQLLTQAQKLKDPAQLAAVYRGLARQQASAAKVAPKVGRLVLAEAKEDEERLTRGEAGFPVDPKTGEPAQDTPEAKQALLDTKARGAMLVEALRCLGALGSREPSDDKTLAAFLQNPYDELVVETLGLLGRRRSFHALPAMLELYRMYPDPAAMDTGFIVQEHGMSADGRKKWLALFGHPMKQRSRPAVVKALREALERITGKKMEAPRLLGEYLSRKDVQAKLESRGRR